MELNKHILLVMKWLNDKDSVSRDDIIENRRSAAYTAAYTAAYAAAADADAAGWVNKYFERTDENKQDYIDAIEAGKKAEESNHYNQPNWDEAPSKDAVWIESADNGCGWHIYQNGYFYQCDDKSHGWSLCDDEKGVITVHKRPIETSQEWDGEGLPPIGCECEATGRWNDFERPVNLKDGQKVKILMDYKCPKTGTDGVIFTWIEGADNIRTEWTGNEKHFRPLKTQDQKDREAFIEWGKKGLSYRLEEQSFAIQILEQLADNGAKAPEGE